MAELYHLSTDPGENVNLINDRRYTRQLAQLRKDLAKLLRETGAEPDKMPLHEVVKSYLPEKSIR